MRTARYTAGFRAAADAMNAVHIVCGVLVAVAVLFMLQGNVLRASAPSPTPAPITEKHMPVHPYTVTVRDEDSDTKDFLVAVTAGAASTFLTKAIEALYRRLRRRKRA